MTRAHVGIMRAYRLCVFLKILDLCPVSGVTKARITFESYMRLIPTL